MRKGFTLIELLAVIVILAIILVIAVPKIFEVIESSRKEALVSSTKNLMSALEKTSISLVRGNEYKDIFVMYENGVKTVYPSNANVDYKGINPQSGVIIYGKEGNVVLSLYNGKYCVSKLKDNEEIVIEEISENECIEKIMYKQSSAPFSNMMEGLKYIRTTDYANSADKQITLNNGHSYYISYKTTLIGGVTNSASRDIRIVTPSFILGDPTQDGYYSRKFLYDITTATASVYLYGPATDEGSGRIINWENVVLIDLTSAGLDRLSKQELDEMTTSWFNDAGSLITPKTKFVGKNLVEASPSAWETGTINGTTNELSSSTSRIRTKGYYTFNGINELFYQNYNNYQLAIRFYDANYNFLYGSTITGFLNGNDLLNNSFNIPIPNGAVYFKLVCAKIPNNLTISANDISLSQVQIANTATATTYESYIESYYFEVNLFNKLWYDTTTNIPKKFLDGSWIEL